jgi:hypothetical protein
VVLGWKAGREAATHDVYVSTDEQAVIDGTAPVVTVAEPSYGPLALDLDTTHYWKVNEVNEAETITTWPSELWSFTTSDHIVVDDFESYNDLDPGDPASKRIFNVWIDGFQVPTNGSLVGYENPPFCEQNIVHGGEQSMPFFYSNTGGAVYSEAELTLSPTQNWTEASVATLAVYFHGTSGNTGQLYVKVNGSKVVYDGDAGDIAKVEWKQWNIDLASLGIDLQNVTSLAIGIDGNGASGTLYVDDVGLYRVAPEHTEAHAEHPQNGPIFTRKSLQQSYNPKGPYLPISQKQPSHKPCNSSCLQKSQNLRTDSMAAARCRAHCI